MNPRLSNGKAFWFMLIVGLLTVGTVSHFNQLPQIEIPSKNKCDDKDGAILRDAEQLARSGNQTDRLKAVQLFASQSDCSNNVSTTASLAMDILPSLSSAEDRLEVTFAVLHSLENARLGDIALTPGEQSQALSVAKQYLEAVLKDNVSEKPEVVKQFCDVVGQFATELEAGHQSDEAKRWEKIRTKYQRFGVLIPQTEKIKKKIRRYEYNLEQFGKMAQQR